MRVPQIVVLLGCFVIGVAIAIAYANVSGSIGERRPTHRPSKSQALIPTILPTETAAPEDVVQRQLDSLRDASVDPETLRTCYAFASPRNRATIGSFDNFAGMVGTPHYRALLGHTGRMIGQPVVQGDRATVLVTVIDRSGAPHAYRFWLAKQTEPPYVACWMTDGVLPVGQQSRLDFPIKGPTRD